MRNALAAVLAMAAAPNGFTVTGFADQVRIMTGQATKRIQHPARLLRLQKIRGNTSSRNREGPRRYHVPPDAARTIAALLTLRDQVIAQIVAVVQTDHLDPGRPRLRNPADRPATLFTHLGITTIQAAAA